MPKESDVLAVASLSYQPGEVISYARFHSAVPDSSEPRARYPLLVIPGYLGGIEAYTPFAESMAELGYDVIVPDQNRQGIARVGRGQPAAAISQARNIAAVVEAENLQGQRVDVVAHSYGAPIVEQLIRIEQSKEDWDCFNNARVILGAPAEIHKEYPLAFWLRRTLLSQIYARLAPVERLEDDHRTLQGSADRAAEEFWRANPKRARLELREAATRTIDLEALQRSVGKLAIMLFAGDRMFPDARFASNASRRSFSSLYNVVVFSPSSSELLSEREPWRGIRGARGSDHWDMQANPDRVAGAVDMFLRPEKYAGIVGQLVGGGYSPQAMQDITRKMTATPLLQD